MTSGGVHRLVEAVKEARATFGKEARAICEGVATLVARMTERANILQVCERMWKGSCELFVVVPRKIEEGSKNLLWRKERRRFGKEISRPLFKFESSQFTPIHFRCSS